MRLPLSLYSRCVASTPHGCSPGASAARACTPGSAIAAAVSAANRGLIAPTPTSADAGRCSAAFLGAVRAELLRRLVCGILDCHHRLGQRATLPGLYGRATRAREQRQDDADERDSLCRQRHLATPPRTPRSCWRISARSRLRSEERR